MEVLDTTDKKLLHLLQQDAKQTTKQLALQLDLSVTAVYERIKKLEKKGIITNYVAKLSAAQLHKNFVVLCHLKLNSHKKDQILQFEKNVALLDEVIECFHVSGDYDYILKIVVANMEDYREFMVSKLTTLPSIGATHSIFVINEVKNTTILPL